MSNYDTSAIKVYDNSVLSIAFKNQLTTRMDMNQFITMDYSLSENPGMIKKIRTYTGTGSVEDLAMGIGNSTVIGVNWVETPYEVKTTQGKISYYDEQEMDDPDAIDKCIEHLSELMTNDTTAKVVAEFAKGTNVKYSYGFDFDGTVDAIASFPEEVNDGLFMLISRKDLAKFQKNLKTQLSYVEAFVRTGYIGNVAGVPIYVTDACSEGEAYLANREAVTCFMKKNSTVERDRDIDKRENILIGRVVKVIALTNNDKVVVLKASVRQAADTAEG